MPEGPSLVILKETALPFVGKTILDAKGNAKIDMHFLKKQKVIAIKTWGKQFFIQLKNKTIRIHFLMFGSYSINEQTKPDKSLRLALYFKSGALYFYTCAIKILEGDLDDLYDWSADVLSKNWSASHSRKKILAQVFDNGRNANELIRWIY